MAALVYADIYRRISRTSATWSPLKCARYIRGYLFTLNWPGATRVAETVLFFLAVVCGECILLPFHSWVFFPAFANTRMATFAVCEPKQIAVKDSLRTCSSWPVGDVTSSLLLNCAAAS